MITSPYAKLELVLAVNELNDEKIDQIEKFFEDVGDLEIKDKAELNAKVAAHNGISLELLMASPNYQALLEDYQSFLVTSLIERLEKELGLSNEQAWGLVMGGMGLLD